MCIVAVGHVVGRDSFFYGVERTGHGAVVAVAVLVAGGWWLVAEARATRRAAGG